MKTLFLCFFLTTTMCCCNTDPVVQVVTVEVKRPHLGLEKGWCPAPSYLQTFGEWKGGYSCPQYSRCSELNAEYASCDCYPGYFSDASGERCVPYIEMSQEPSFEGEQVRLQDLVIRLPDITTVAISMAQDSEGGFLFPEINGEGFRFAQGDGESLWVWQGEVSDERVRVVADKREGVVVTTCLNHVSYHNGLRTHIPARRMCTTIFSFGEDEGEMCAQLFRRFPVVKRNCEEQECSKAYLLMIQEISSKLRECISY